MNVVVRKSRSRWPVRRPQRWYVVIIAGNGRVLLTSELYTNRVDAQELADRLVQWGAA